MSSDREPDSEPQKGSDGENIAQDKKGPIIERGYPCVKRYPRCRVDSFLNQ